MSAAGELAAMAVIADALEPLERATRKRALSWAWARYVPPTLFDMAPAPVDEDDGEGVEG